VDITLTPAFSVPIFSYQLNEFDTHRQAIVDLVLAQRARDPGLQLSNRYAWHSGGDLHLSTDSHVRWLMNQVSTFVRGALGSYFDMEQPPDITMSSCWANAGGRGAWNTPHNHMPSHWSGVIYVQADGCQENEEDLGGLIEFLNPYPVGVHYGQQMTSTFEPKNGLVLLFPAYLVHYVHPNRQDRTRISISFNLDVSL
jgi:uncharacterized protein (TIGR02466 family)